MNKHKLAIVGYGGMGGWHEQLLREGDGIEGLSLAGIWDIDEKRRAAAREQGILAYGSFEELLAGDADIVLAATPNDSHREIVTRALRAGKNAVAEKPVACYSWELEEMIAAANETGRLFTVHQNRRWDEDFLTMKKVYTEGLLGPVFNVESRVHGSRGIPGDWRKDKIHGGGMMLDWGVHLIDQAFLMIPERVKSIYCTVDHVTNGEVDDGFRLILTFESGIRFLLEVGTSNFVNLPRWYMQGDNGTAIIEDWNLNGKIVRIKNWDKNDAVPVKTAAGLTKTMAPRTDETIATESLPIVRSDIKDFYRNVMAAVDGEAASLIRHDELLRVMRLMEAAFAAAEANSIVPFE